MNWMLRVIRMLYLSIIAWCISFGGLCYLGAQLLKVDAEWAPMITASIIVSVLTIAGMAGGLEYFAFALYIVGFIGVILALANIRKITAHRIIIIAVFFIWISYLMIMLPSQTIIHQDDFAHWALVARHTLTMDAFPDVSMELMHFPSYPLGSAAFIYYFCRFIENSDGMYLFAQAFLGFCYVVPMFAFIRNAFPSGVVTFAALFMLALTTNTFIDRLQVDTLLAFMGFGASALAMTQREKNWRAVLKCAPVLIALAYIKTSGLFFAFLCAVILASGAKNKKAACAMFIAAAGISVMAYCSWQVYASIEFPQMFESTHALNPVNYAVSAQDRGWKLALYVLKAYVSRIRRSSMLETALLGIAILVPLALLLKGRLTRNEQNKKEGIQLFAFSGIAYILYNIMLLLVYVFSMTKEEATTLASFTRYYRTMLVYLLLITSAVVFRSLYRSNTNGHKIVILRRVIAAAAVFSVLFGIFTDGRINSIFKPFQKYGYYEQLKAMHRDSDINPYGKYVILVSGEKEINEIQLNMMLLYELNTMDVICVISMNDDDSGLAYRVYDRRKETEKAGGIFYLLNDIPSVYLNEIELKTYIENNTDNEDNVLVLGSEDEFSSIIEFCNVEDYRIIQ